MIKKLLLKYKELILYVFFGGLTTLVNLGTFALLAEMLHMNYIPATVISWIISVLFAYITNRIWVFESKVTGVKGILLELLKFFVFRGLSGLLDLGCMYVGVDLLHVNQMIMKLVSNVLVVIANYVFSKIFIFRKPADEAAERSAGQPKD